MRDRRSSLLLLSLTLLALPLSAAIRGTVIDTDGKPVAGASVRAYAMESSAARMSRLASDAPDRVALATASADSKGAFALDVKTTPAVELLITAPGFRSAGDAALAEDDLGSIALRPTTTRKGTILAGGKAATNTLIVVHGPGETQQKSGDGTFNVSADGAFTSLVLIRPGSAVTSLPFPDANRKTWTLALDPGVRLTGLVTRRDGTPAGGAHLLVDGWPAGDSSADGTFVIEHAPTQWKELRAVAESEWARATNNHAKRVTLRLAIPARIRATVLDGVTGKAIPFARLETNQRDGQFSESFLADGKGTVDLPLPPAQWTVAASFPHYAGASTEVMLKAGDSAKATVTLQPESRVAGIVLDEEKNPMAGAAVYSTADNWSFATDFRTVFTGADGRFLLRGVTPAAQLIVRASRKGLPPARSSQFKLAAGERKTGITLTIPRGFPVAGIVRNAAGKPIPDVQVFALVGDENLRYMSSFLMERAEADRQSVKSNADGTFRVQVAEGRYDVYFKREGYATLAVRGITVSAKTPLVEAQLEEAVEVTGRVVRSGGTPVADITVGGTARGERIEGGRTAPDGTFTVSGVPAGPFTLSFWKPDEMLTIQRSVTAPVRDLVVELPPGGTISGRVIDASTKDPIADFSIGASQTVSGGGRVSRNQARTHPVHDDDGRFVLENMPAATLDLVASAPGYVVKRVSGLKVEEGKGVTDLEVALETGTTLVGKVTGPDGAAIAGATVFEERNNSAIYESDRTYTVTDGDGEFRLPALESSERLFRFLKEGYATERRSVKLSGKETRLDVRLSAGMTLTGSVVNATGAPVAEAQVSGYSPTEGWQGGNGISDDAGIFHLDGLRPGHYTVVARKSGLADAKLEDIVIDGTPAPIVLHMGAGGVVVGHITGLSAAELSFVQVYVGSSTGRSSGRPDATGAFRIEGAPVGHAEVSAYLNQPGHVRSTARKPVEVTASSETTAELDFPEGVVIRGKVTRAGQPLAGSYVSFMGINPATPSSGTESTDAAGGYEVHGLSAGWHQVTVSDSNRRNLIRTTYEVSSSTTYDIEASGKGLHGRVVDADTDAPIANAIVSLQARVVRDSYASNDVVTDAGGGFTIDALGDGDYVVRVTREGYGHNITETAVPSSSDLLVKLTRSAGITARMVDTRDGKTVTGWLAAWDPGNRFVARSTQGTDGETSLLPVAAGEYLVGAFVYGFAPALLRVTSPTPSELRIPLTVGGTLAIESSFKEPRQIRLIRADGIIYHASDNSLDGTITLNGARVIEHTTPGSYTLQLLDGRQQVAKTYPVTVNEGQVTKVSL